MSSKPWREGGRYPQYSFTDFREILLHGYLSAADLQRLWTEVVRSAQAESKFSSVEGGLPPYYSFVEEVQKVTDDLVELELGIWYTDLPYLALRSGTPENWEFVPVL